jgi:uncharacterized MAPEG superfamily protein
LLTTSSKVPLALVLALFPGTYATIAAGNTVDRANPRTADEAIVKSDAFDKATKARILRAKAASANAFETLGFFAAAVVAANAAQVDVKYLNQLSIAYLVIRAGYNFAYIVLCANRRLAPVRSALWASSVAVMGTLWLLAARAAYKA